MELHKSVSISKCIDIAWITSVVCDIQNLCHNLARLEKPILSQERVRLPKNDLVLLCKCKCLAEGNSTGKFKVHSNFLCIHVFVSIHDRNHRASLCHPHESDANISTCTLSNVDILNVHTREWRSILTKLSCPLLFDDYSLCSLFPYLLQPDSVKDCLLLIQYSKQQITSIRWLDDLQWPTSCRFSKVKLSENRAISII